MIFKILFLYTINSIFLLKNSIANDNSSETTYIDISTIIEDSTEFTNNFSTPSMLTSELSDTFGTTSNVKNDTDETNTINFTNPTVSQNETESLIESLNTTLDMNQVTTSQQLIISSTTTLLLTHSKTQNNSSRVVVTLVIFGTIGILIILAFLLYVWRKTKLEENKYVTLAERLNTQSSRPSSPNIRMNEDLFVNNVSNETVFSNPGFSLQERSAKDDNFKFDFDDIINEQKNNESNV